MYNKRPTALHDVGSWEHLWPKWRRYKKLESTIEGFQQVVEHALEYLQTSMSKLEKELGKVVEF